MYSSSSEQGRRTEIQALAEKLYRERYHYLLGIARRNGASAADAGDAVNDAFAAFISKFDPDCEAPPLAAVVRRIFAEYLAGQSQLAITRGLIADGIPTGRGGEWHQGTLRSILTNPALAGLVHDGEELIEATHETVVEREVWEQAAALRRGQGPHPPPRPAKRRPAPVPQRAFCAAGCVGLDGPPHEKLRPVLAKKPLEQAADNYAALLLL
ncbi:MAG TPA: recombinase family protein [Solirubrobacterales bacterium]|jgi:hypothetical protein|nr:recombinase family protein [Solirubrobacterales bacterium]